jgi:hypothetical protein
VRRANETHVSITRRRAAALDRGSHARALEHPWTMSRTLFDSMSRSQRPRTSLTLAVRVVRPSSPSDATRCVLDERRGLDRDQQPEIVGGSVAAHRPALELTTAALERTSGSGSTPRRQPPRSTARSTPCGAHST